MYFFPSKILREDLSGKICIRGTISFSYAYYFMYGFLKIHLVFTIAVFA